MPPSPSAIPLVAARLRGPRLFPFTYETEPEAIRLVLDDYTRALELERRCLAWALKQGRARTARQSRAFIDQLELRRRNGEARLRSLAGNHFGTSSPLCTLSRRWTSSSKN